MADFVFNVSMGKVNEYVARVDGNDPTNSVLVVVAIVATATDATMRDYDTLSALLGDANVAEATNTNYARKVLSDTDVTAPTPDDTNDRQESDIPDQTWSAVAAGDNWTDLVICYDSDSTGGTDANIVPLTLHDFAVTPDGSDITAQINAAGFFRAS